MAMSIVQKGVLVGSLTEVSLDVRIVLMAEMHIVNRKRDS